jgi:ethanolamine ammonia-lyase large subunit
MYKVALGGEQFSFVGLAHLLGRAGEEKAGDRGAGLAARDGVERAAAKMALADVRLSDFLDAPVVDDAVTELLLDRHDAVAFSAISSYTVGELRELVLDRQFPDLWAAGLVRAITPEMAAAVAKIMSDKDLAVAASRLRTVTRFRTTMGEAGVFGSRLQPNHPTDDIEGILVSIIDGLLLGCGDALIGVNPVDDSVESIGEILRTLHHIISLIGVPTQSCVLGHVTTQLRALERGAPVDLIFQSLAGTEHANKTFGVTIPLLLEANEAVHAAHAEREDCVGVTNVTYFETGQGSAYSAGAHGGVDQLTLEARAQGLAKCFDPFLVNSVVGFIGPEYLATGLQIIRAGLEDHFTGKLQGVPMGCDVCFTNHVDADQNSNDDLLMLMGVAGSNFIMALPGGDDVMLGYQSTSCNDVHTVRQLLGLRPAPEFQQWLEERGIWADGDLCEPGPSLVAQMVGAFDPELALAR